MKATFTIRSLSFGFSDHKRHTFCMATNLIPSSLSP
jgi:hypothetical protein